MIKQQLIAFFLSIIFTSTLFSNEIKEHAKLPLSVSLPYLTNLESDALTLGNGVTKVYVFVDPFCPHSRNFLSMIAESEKMQERYSYYIFLYTLPRMKSEAMVSTIYASEKPLETLLDVMVRHVDVTPAVYVNVGDKVKRIAEVAKKIDVYKRPYLIMVKKPKKKQGK